jgi:hypothetical protein
MFGTDNSQQTFAAPAAAQTNDEDIMKNGSLEQPDTVSGAHQPNDGATTVDTTNIFSTTPVADPFGTSTSTGATTVVADTSTPTTQHDDPSLLDIKQQALQHLSPLVQHLDQAPEEKFKTTMMMIQASDDKSLVPAAFEAAKQIESDKVRAQALLDIINEINYFTQK